MPSRVRRRRGPDDKLNVVSSSTFFLLHLLPFLAIFTGVTRTALILAFVTFTVRMFFITAGYHRYFSHKSYRLNRFWQFVLAFGGTMASQKGPLWWAAHHRNHHRFSDTERDVHSPKRGFWWSHIGWILCDKYNEADLQPDPRLRQVSRAALHQQARLDRAVDARRAVLRDRRLERPAHRVLRLDRAALARHLHRQLGRPRDGPARRTRPPTRAATRCSSRWRPAARAGTTTTTATRGRRARASAGGRSTRRTTACGS